MEKNKFAVFLFGDEKYLFAIGNTLLQLKRFDFINSFIVFLDSSKDTSINKLLKQIDNRIDINNQGNFLLSKYLNKENYNSDFIKRYSPSLFFRIFALDYLNTYENILILDSDNYYRTNFSDIKNELNKGEISYRPVDKLNRYDKNITSDIMYPSGAVINLNKSLYKNKTKIYETFFNYINNNINLPHIDECAFAYISLINNLKINYLSDKYNSFIIRDHSESSAIVCSVGKYKFWSHPLCNILYQDWNNYNAKWNCLCKASNLKKYCKDIKIQISINELFEIYEKYYNKCLNSEFTKIYEFFKYKLESNKELNFSTDTSKSWYFFYHKNLPKTIHYEFFIDKGKIYFSLHFETENKKYNIQMMDFFYDLYINKNITMPYKISKTVSGNIYGIQFNIDFYNNYNWFELYIKIMQDFYYETLPYLLSKNQINTSNSHKVV